MNNQEVFDKVRQHLLTQNRKALSGTYCCYRTREGLSCAIGCLIPNESYSEDLEGKTATHREVLAAAGIPDNISTVLLQDLQRVHDSSQPEQWREMLDVVAVNHHLTIPQETL